MGETKTKLLFLIVDQGVEPDVRDVLREKGVEHFTSWEPCHGSGETGKRDGTAVWPGLNTALMIVIPEEQVEPLIKRLHEVRDTFPITPGMKVIITDAVIV